LRAAADERLDLAFVSQVGANEQRTPRRVELALGAPTGIGVAAAEAHAQPFGEQALDGGTANATGPACDKRYARDMITISMRIDILNPATSDGLGEGPVWLEGDAALLRVDIDEPAILLRDTTSGLERRRRLTAPVGFALPTARGGFVAGVRRELVHLPAFDAAPRRLTTVETTRRRNRFNDAACDACGRLWAGTMSTTREPGAAALYRYVAGGAAEVALAGVTISNGLDWNLDATRLYYVDSTTQRIDALDFDLDRGRLGNRRPFVTIDRRDGLPDGLCVDAAGGVWVALFGGGAIRRYTPDGALDEHVRLPVTNPTSVAFGGCDLSELYVTSARHRLTRAQLALEPSAGAVMRLRPGVTGRPPWRFRGL
jgi:sugar lactone lactonase YvrE